MWWIIGSAVAWLLLRKNPATGVSALGSDLARHGANRQIVGGGVHGNAASGSGVKALPISSAQRPSFNLATAFGTATAPQIASTVTGARAPVAAAPVFRSPASAPTPAPVYSPYTTQPVAGYQPVAYEPFAPAAVDMTAELAAPLASPSPVEFTDAGPALV